MLMTRENILTVDASSPEELREKLSGLSLKERPRVVALAVCGPQVIVRPFHFENISLKEVKNRIKMEAVELLSLTVDEIAFDLQVLKTNLSAVEGVFTCAPLKLIDEYCAVLKRARLTPVKITAFLFARVNSFFRKHKNIMGRFCLIDFAQHGEINLAVFNGREYELLREIPYANADEAAVEIIQSLRSASAKSSEKEIKNIFISGDFEKKDHLIKELEHTYQAAVKEDASNDVSQALLEEENYFRLNLAKDCFCSPGQRRWVLTAAHAALILLALNVIVGGIRIIKNNFAIGHLRGSFTNEEYRYAEELQRQMKKQ